MAIPVSCSCGKQVNAPEHLAGKKVKCPACGQPLAIPSGGGAFDGLFDDEGITASPRCPQCKADIDAGAVLCIQCGFNLATGKQVKGVNARGGGHEGNAERLLQQAEEELEDSPIKHDGAYGGATQEWAMTAVMLAVALAVVAAAYFFFQHMEKRYKAQEKDTDGEVRRLDEESPWALQLALSAQREASTEILFRPATNRAFAGGVGEFVQERL
ncbi:MAG: hypothetical protein KDB14_22195 [Planctomycetales bacterium]|nr:hypothetical protein [Planctomycetales bacterium]